MERTRVSSKGQVVIPKSVRNALGIGLGAVLNVEALEGAVVLRPVRKEKRLPTREELDRVAGCLARPSPYPSREEEEAAVAEMFRREWRGKRSPPTRKSSSPIWRGPRIRPSPWAPNCFRPRLSSCPRRCFSERK